MILKKDGRYFAYLRKSRADLEAEKLGEGETLKRHEAILFSLAKSYGIVISHVFKEIVSGETIASRPVIQEVLQQIEQNLWDGCLVVEVERLARGDSIDQGIIAQTFKYSDTLIITPQKIFNPNNNEDEEYFEFGLFMSRREYKTINRRLNAGRISSVREGKYVGNIAPYGYDRVKLERQKGFSLVENKEEANVVRLIFDMYAHGYSYSNIVDKLNNLNIKPRIAEKWKCPSIKSILSNDVYISNIHWKKRKQVKNLSNGKIQRSRPVNRDESDVIIKKGLHEALIDEVVWDKVQQRLSLHAPRTANKLQNPLASLIICGKCGEKMQRRPYYDRQQEASLICTNKNCDNISSKLCIVEQQVIEALKKWLNDKTINYDREKMKANNQVELLENLLNQSLVDLRKTENKLVKICECFEESIYTKEIYFERSQVVMKEITECKEKIKNLEIALEKAKSEKENFDTYIPKIQHVIDVYFLLDDMEERNEMLKLILEKIVYTKTERAIKKDSDPTNFSLQLYPKIAKNI